MTQPQQAAQPWLPLVTPRRIRIAKALFAFLRLLPGALWPFLLHALLLCLNPSRYAAALLFALPPPIAFLLFPARKSPLERFRAEAVWLLLWMVFGPLFLFAFEPPFRSVVSLTSSSPIRPSLSHLVYSIIAGIAYGTSPLGHALHWAVFWALAWVGFSLTSNLGLVVWISGGDRAAQYRSDRDCPSSPLPFSFASHLSSLSFAFEHTLRKAVASSARAATLPSLATTGSLSSLAFEDSFASLRRRWTDLAVLYERNPSVVQPLEERVRSAPASRRSTAVYQTERALLLLLLNESIKRREPSSYRDWVQRFHAAAAIASAHIFHRSSASEPSPSVYLSTFFFLPFFLWDQAALPPPTAPPLETSTPPPTVLTALLSSVPPFVAACSALDPPLKPPEVLGKGLVELLRCRDVRRAEERLLEEVLQAVLKWKEARNRRVSGR
ncbi:hypothetical protein JCM6882_005939 [Rhodosporidiobolus microsporus]